MPEGLTVDCNIAVQVLKDLRQFVCPFLGERFPTHTFFVCLISIKGQSRLKISFY